MHSGLEQLVRSLSKLPGVGKRSAERMALRLVTDKSLAHNLSESITTASNMICQCSRCGYITDKDNNPCHYCSSPRRDNSILCVIETSLDLDLIEESGSFTGRYFCLLGKISPISGSQPLDARVRQLARIIQEEGVKEVLLALNSDVESDASASFLVEVLTTLGVKVSRLAFGIPVGSGLAYSDPVTVSRAISGRQGI